MDEININEELYQYYAVSSDGTSLVNVNDLLNIQDDNNRTVQKVFYMALNDLTEEQQEHEQQQLQQQQQQQQLQQQQQQEININEMLPQESSFNNLLVSNDLKLVSLNDGKIFMTSTSKDETLDTIQSQFILNGPDYNIIDNDASDDNNLVSLTSTIESVIPNYDESNIKYQLIELADGTKAIVKLYELKNNTTVTSGETIENCVLDQAKEDEIEEDNNNNNNNNNDDDDDDDDDDEEEEDETFVQPRKPIKKFHCSYEGCDKVYCSSYHLNVHMRRHTDNKPFPCHMDGCDKKFSTNYSLKAHIRTHTGEKPYGCILCDKHFKTSGDLQKHIRIHTGEKPFVCPVEGCNKSFTTSNIRKVHIRSHTGERPYVCSYPNCGKAFTSSTNYKNHIRIHSGEKPYLCSVEGCGRRFTEYSSLYKHNAVHQPSRPHNCNLCEQKFKQEQALNMHKRVVHNVVACTMDGTDIIVKIN